MLQTDFLKDCQLQELSSFCLEIPRRERVWLSMLKSYTRFMKRIARVSKNPSLLLQKLMGSKREVPAGSPRKMPVLGLLPGERIRIKSREAIRETLDERGRYEGLSYMASVMDRYCGGIYTVKKRIDYFFDEKNWKLVKLRDVVILDGVYCESPLSSSEAWAGCDRTCFLFWKEAWLERVKK